MPDTASISEEIKLSNALANRSLTRKTTVVLLVVLLVSFAGACGNNVTFSSSAWLAGDARARGRMAENLVQSKALLGQTVEEARRLLGPPDTDYGGALQYQIDLGWLFKNPKHYGLQLHLDENRKVRLVKIVD